MKKNILLFIASIFLVIFSDLAVNTSLAYKVSIKIPIAIHKNFPIPVFFWLGVCAYVLLTSLINKEPLKNGFKKTLALGFFLHLFLLLMKLKIQVAINPAISTSFSYKIYFDLFILFSVAFLSIFCAMKTSFYKKMSSQDREERFKKDTLYFPFLLMFVYVLIFLFRKGFFINFGFATILFFVGFYISSRTEKATFILKKLQIINQFIFRERNFLILLFFLAFLIRIFYLSRVMSDPNYILTGSDGTLYDGLAKAFLKGEKVTEPLVAGYWMFLALIYKMFGSSYLIVGLIQSFLSALSCIFVYFTAKYIFNNPRTAKIASLFCALSFPLVFSAVAIGHQVMDTFYVTLALMFVSRYVYLQANLRKKTFFLIILGLIFGLSIATREVNFFFTFIVVSWLIFFFYKKIGLKAILVDALIIVIFLFIALIPFIARNINNIGVWYPVFPTPGAPYDITGHCFKGHNPDLVAAGVDITDLNKTWTAFLERPVFVYKVIFSSFFTKFKELYFSQGYGGFDMIFLYRLSDYYYALWFYVYLITIIGVFVAFKRYRLGIHSLLFFFIIYRTFVHFLTEAAYRHRVAIEPALILYFSFGLYSLVNFIKNSKQKNQKNFYLDKRNFTKKRIRGNI